MYLLSIDVFPTPLSPTIIILNSMIFRINDKYFTDPVSGKLVIDNEWHEFLEKVWTSNFKSKIMDETGTFNDEFKNVVDIALKAAILNNLLILIKEEYPNIRNIEVFWKLKGLLNQKGIISVLLGAGILDSFCMEVYSQAFYIQNIYKIVQYVGWIIWKLLMHL